MPHHWSLTARLLAVTITAALLVPAVRVSADEFVAVGRKRQTVYHSPQKPGFTSWVGAWVMPGGDLMVSFTHATGPLKDRKGAPKEVQAQLNWPPKGAPGYDMTGLDLRNVHLRSTDAGRRGRR